MNPSDFTWRSPPSYPLNPFDQQLTPATASGSVPTPGVYGTTPTTYGDSGVPVGMGSGFVYRPGMLGVDTTLTPGAPPPGFTPPGIDFRPHFEDLLPPGLWPTIPMPWAPPTNPLYFDRWLNWLIPGDDYTTPPLSGGWQMDFGAGAGGYVDPSLGGGIDPGVPGPIHWIRDQYRRLGRFRRF